MKNKDSLTVQIEEFALNHQVPIMDRWRLKRSLDCYRIQNPKRILEIGSAIGYSAIRIASALPDTSIVTIERDIERYEKAVEFIERSELSNRIRIIEADALELETSENIARKFDALFIDAAKGQYKRFFEKYSPQVNTGGVIYCDNMFMHGMVLLGDGDIPRRKRTMIRNLKEFTKWIMSHPNYETALLPVGDGLLIATKK